MKLLLGGLFGVIGAGERSTASANPSAVSETLGDVRGAMEVVAELQKTHHSCERCASYRHTEKRLRASPALPTFTPGVKITITCPASDGQEQPQQPLTRRGADLFRSTAQGPLGAGVLAQGRVPTYPLAGSRRLQKL